MSANSLLASEASSVSDIQTAGAVARMSGDAANVLPVSDLSLVKTGGRKSEKKGGEKRKSEKKSKKGGERKSEKGGKRKSEKGGKRKSEKKTDKK